MTDEANITSYRVNLLDPSSGESDMHDVLRHVNQNSSVKVVVISLLYYFLTVLMVLYCCLVAWLIWRRENARSAVVEIHAESVRNDNPGSLDTLRQVSITRNQVSSSMYPSLPPIHEEGGVFGTMVNRAWSPHQPPSNKTIPKHCVKPFASPKPRPPVLPTP